MDAIEALKYLNEQHKAIASDYSRSHRRYQLGCDVSQRERIAIEIVAANDARDTTKLVTLANEWAKVSK
jgi:hypothetical protein